MWEFAAGTAAARSDCATFRTVLRSIPVFRLISRCETLFCSSVTTVLLCCGVKTFTPKPLVKMEGGSCPVVATAATADYSIGLTRYWGILKWPSLGEFGWPPGPVEQWFDKRIAKFGLVSEPFVKQHSDMS